MASNLGHPAGLFLRENIQANGFTPRTGSIEEALRSGKRFVAYVIDPKIGGHAVIVEGVEDMYGVPNLLVKDPARGAYFENLEWFTTQRRISFKELGYDAIWIEELPY